MDSKECLKILDRIGASVNMNPAGFSHLPFNAENLVRVINEHNITNLVLTELLDTILADVIEEAN